jgi:hypothetical protein
MLDARDCLTISCPAEQTGVVLVAHRASSGQGSEAQAVGSVSSAASKTPSLPIPVLAASVLSRALIATCRLEGDQLGFSRRRCRRLERFQGTLLQPYAGELAHGLIVTEGPGGSRSIRAICDAAMYTP